MHEPVSDFTLEEREGMTVKKILIVDDDLHQRTLVRTYAELDGFQCREAENGQAALDAVEEANFHIIVLDVMMPVMDGFETLAELRKACSTPVIMLTARSEEYDRLFGFNLGADDYVPKPFSPKELMARIKAVLRRSEGVENGRIKFGDLEIFEDARVASLRGDDIPLSPKEFDLLLFMAKNNRVALARDHLLRSVWGFDYYGDERTVDTHIKSLRLRMGDCRKLISTVWGVGYKFDYKDGGEHA